MANDRAPQLAEVIRRHIDAYNVELSVSIPAAVTSYDPASQKVSCKPLIKEPYLDEDEQRQVLSLPVIPGVPVVFPGAGGFRVTFPISDGNLIIEGSTVPATTGLLVFADRSIDRWLSGIGHEVDPEIDHLHSITDAVFIPGLNPFGAALSSAPNDHATLGADSGVQAHFHKQIIALGDEAGNDFVALAQKVLTELQSISTAFNSHTHAAGTFTTGIGGGAVSGISTIPNDSYNANSVAASQVKAK